MCSIYGAFGQPNLNILEKIRERAKDRGRDGGRMERYILDWNRVAYLGNWRATPTPEIEQGRLQPYDRVVHNGTIANAEELGLQSGQIDSEVLPRVLDRSSLGAFAESLSKIKGSYAIAITTDSTVYLACNYKPIYYWSRDGRTTYFSSMARHFVDVLPRGQFPVKLTPYSALDLSTFESVGLLPEQPKRAIVICSGGLDSTVVASKLKSDGWEICLMHFLYGCKAEDNEAKAVKAIAGALQCPRIFSELPYGEMAGTSPLLREEDTISTAISGAEYANEWVPARNLVFLSLAIAYAEAHGYHAVALANNLEESGSYPDNEEEFTAILNQAAPYAVQNGYGMQILSPVGNLMKHEIVKLGLEVQAPLHLTWSCYRGQGRHCGECGPCFMRREAFKRNGVEDPVFDEKPSAVIPRVELGRAKVFP